MGTIKDIYEIAKDGIRLKQHVAAIKRALKMELVLNKKLLEDIAKGKKIDDIRRKKIISNLCINELSDAVKYEIPYTLICAKTVDANIVGSLNFHRVIGYNFEKMVEKLYLKIAYLQKDYDNESLDLNSRLIFIYKYNLILLRLLS
jgi:hypothetical protein